MNIDHQVYRYGQNMHITSFFNTVRQCNPSNCLWCTRINKLLIKTLFLKFERKLQSLMSILKINSTGAFQPSFYLHIFSHFLKIWSKYRELQLIFNKFAQQSGLTYNFQRPYKNSLWKKLTSVRKSEKLQIQWALSKFNSSNSF